MTEKIKDNKLFTPIDGVIVEIKQIENKSGMELPEGSGQKNEGIIVSTTIKMSKDIYRKYQSLELKKGQVVKFLEGFDLSNGLFYVRIDQIIGVFK